MRVLVFLVFVITSSGCSGLMVGGGSSGSSSTAEDERAASLAGAADTATANKVKQNIAADAELGEQVIYVSANAGMVRLSGSVASYAARENAEKIAMATDGVKAVENKITVEFSN